jgi:transcriptional regulator with XRE-family HTH domain
MSDQAASDREQLGKLVSQRRRSIGLSVSRAAAMTGISRATWTALESGSRQTEDYVLGAVERTLQWELGSIEGILAGGEPVSVGDAPRDEPAGDRAVVLQIIEVLRSPFSDRVKISMIADVIDRDFRPGQMDGTEQSKTA